MNIYILSDSQADIKALDSFQINSKSIWDCHQSLVKLAEHKRIQLLWVPRNMRNDGNERADQLARQGSSHPLIAPEPAIGTSAKVAREVIRDWESRKHEEYWQSIHGQRQAKGFLKRPSATRAGELSNFSRNQVQIMMGLLTRHSHLKGHLFKLGLVHIPGCDRCKQASETASHIPCDYDALATLRFRHLGQHFMKPGDSEDISISRILHFVKGARLLKA
jgi:hypothetical protein